MEGETHPTSPPLDIPTRAKSDDLLDDFETTY